MIPFDKGLPFLGHLFRYQRDKIKFLTQMCKKHGDTFKIKLGNFKLTVITHPDDINHVMQEKFNNYIKSSNVDSFFGTNIFFSNGDVWKNQRKLIQPIFKHDHITTTLLAIEKICNEEFVKLKDSESFNILEFFNDLSFKIITTTIVGKEFKDHHLLKNHFKTITDILTQMKYAGRFNFLLIQRNIDLKTSMEYIDQIIYKIIAQKKTSKDFENDALSHFIQLQAADQSSLSDKDIRDQLVGLIFAGYETTATTMSWVTYLLAKNPQYQKILASEYQSNEFLQNSIIDNILKESMRVYPAAWAWTRVAVEDDQLKNHTIKSGEILFICPYLTHRLEPFWNDPDRFYPERFNLDNKITKGSYIPFGHGPRTCIGMSMAMIEMKVMLKHLIKGFKLIDCNHVPLIRPQITLNVSNGIFIGIKKKADQE